jgi:hypothetical protein
MSDSADIEHSPQDDRPQRNRARLGFTIFIWLLLIAVVVAIFSPLRDVALNHIFPASITPTATVIAGDNQFYIQASPQANITIDGRPVTQLPAVGTGTPIQLSRGQHKIVWQAEPFAPLTCIVSVPPLASEPCNYESPGTNPDAPGTRVISFNASITNLSNAQQMALKQAIQTTLNTLQSTDTLQAGEQYVYAQPNSVPIVKTATQPLNATLSLHLDTNPNSSNPCTPNGDFCTLSGQNCLLICADGGTTSPNGVFTRNIIALYYPTWTYTTQSGQAVAQNQPDTNYTTVGMDHSIDVGATWNGTAWHVSLPSYNNILFSSSSTTPPGTTPPACASIHNYINSTTNYGTGSSPFSSTQGSNTKAVNWGFTVGTNEAQGCLGVVVPSPNTAQTPTDFKQPPAYFLYRFGVLLAANPLAHSEFPSISMADAYEQSIAQGIAAKLQF